MKSKTDYKIMIESYYKEGKTKDYLIYFVKQLWLLNFIKTKGQEKLYLDFVDSLK